MMGAEYSGFLSKKFPVFLGSVMFLSCLAFPLPTFAEETLFTEEAASGNKKSEEKRDFDL